jgi:hypothetical protein
MQMGHLDELMLSLAWKLTLQASGGSDTPSSYTQTQRPQEAASSICRALCTPAATLGSTYRILSPMHPSIGSFVGPKRG